MFGSAVFNLKPDDELSPADINVLLSELKAELTTKGHVCKSGSLQISKDNDGWASAFEALGGKPFEYFVVEKEYPSPSEAKEHAVEKKRFVVFHVTKDSSPQNEPYLYNVFDLVATFLGSPEKLADKKDQETAQFFQEEKQKQAIFLLPIYQYGTLKKHIVLAVFDTAKNEIQLHDSQGYIKPIRFLKIPTDWVFQDHFATMKKKGLIQYQGPQAHELQEHPHLCGYFLHQWIYAILQTGSLAALNQIKLVPAQIKSKETYKKEWRTVVSRELEKEGFVRIKSPKLPKSWVCVEQKDGKTDGFENRVNPLMQKISATKDQQDSNEKNKQLVVAATAEESEEEHEQDDWDLLTAGGAAQPSPKKAAQDYSPKSARLFTEDEVVVVQQTLVPATTAKLV